MSTEAGYRILRLPEVLEWTGLSKTSLLRLESEGGFPRRVRLTQRTMGWRSDEVSAWLSRRVGEREG